MVIKLLIADDHEIVRTGVRTIFDQSSGIEVVAEASDGLEVVSRCLQSAPDVVLMDIRMPKMDGIEATRQLKAKLKQIYVLIITSNDNREDMFAALAAGADGYCVKDIASKQLILAIQAVYSGAAWLDPQIARVVLGAVTAPGAAPLATPAMSPAFGLSLRELEVLRLLVDGMSNLEIANRLIITTDTVKSHMRQILKKLEVSDRTQAATKAMRQGLV
jgi:DNA-binding NarL/FixJ family response regulator